jgi:hypothetical protein
VANFIIFWWLCSGCSASKQTLTSARLDVHELAHEGKLKLGSHGWLFGAICFEVTGGPDARQLVLEFPRKSASGEPLAFTADDCLLLAERQFWRAIPHVHVRRMQPPSARSVCLVERQHLVFLLPQCAVITYQSTMGHRWDRSARCVEKLRARLRWGASGTIPIKPLGMHERTYQQILGMLAYHEAVRNLGASYALKFRPDQHRAHLWRQWAWILNFRKRCFGLSSR